MFVIGLGYFGKFYNLVEDINNILKLVENRIVRVKYKKLCFIVFYLLNCSIWLVCSRYLLKG